MDVIAVDLRQVALHWVIGKKDHRADALAGHQTPGLIPSEAQPRVLAVFNGGFQARHGRWGMMSHGVSILPPQINGCTLALRQDGSVTLGPWPDLEPLSSEFRAFRQGPPCLVANSKIHKNLESGQTRLWAGTNPDLKTRRRSAVGLDASGETLYFAIGTETQPLDLARGMLALGAVNALQLDINFAWTRFLLAGRREEDGAPRVTSSLVDDSLHGKNEYFGRASDRDFFYLELRQR